MHAWGYTRPIGEEKLELLYWKCPWENNVVMRSQLSASTNWLLGINMKNCIFKATVFFLTILFVNIIDNFYLRSMLHIINKELLVAKIYNNEQIINYRGYLISEGDWILKELHNEKNPYKSWELNSFFGDAQYFHTEFGFEIPYNFSSKIGDAFYLQTNPPRANGQEFIFLLLTNNIWSEPQRFINPLVKEEPYRSHPERLFSFANWSDDGKQIAIISYDVEKRNPVYVFVLNKHSQIVSEYKVNITISKSITFFWKNDKFLFVNKLESEGLQKNEILFFNSQTNNVLKLQNIEGQIDFLGFNDNESQIVGFGTHLGQYSNPIEQFFQIIIDAKSGEFIHEENKNGYCRKVIQSSNGQSYAILIQSPKSNSIRVDKKLLLWDWNKRRIEERGIIADLINWIKTNNGFLILKFDNNGYVYFNVIK